MQCARSMALPSAWRAGQQLRQNSQPCAESVGPCVTVRGTQCPKPLPQRSCISWEVAVSRKARGTAFWPLSPPGESRAHHWARPRVLLGSGVGSGVAWLPSPGVQATPSGPAALSCYRHCLPHWAPKTHLGPVLPWTLCSQPPLPGGLLGHPTSPFLPTPGLCSWPLFQTLPALGLINLPVYLLLFITRYRLLRAQVPIDRSGVGGRDAWLLPGDSSSSTAPRPSG